MPLALFKTIMSRMVAEGSAEYDPPIRGKTPPTRVLIYWKRPNEWATTIYNWVSIPSLGYLVGEGQLIGATPGVNVCADQGVWIDWQHHDFVRAGRRR